MPPSVSQKKSAFRLSDTLANTLVWAIHILSPSLVFAGPPNPQTEAKALVANLKHKLREPDFDQYLTHELQQIVSGERLTDTGTEVFYTEASRSPELMHRIAAVHETFRIGGRYQSSFAPDSTSHNQRVQLEYLDELLFKSSSPRHHAQTPGLYYGTKSLSLPGKLKLSLREFRQDLLKLKAHFRNRTSDPYEIISRERVLQAIRTRTNHFIDQLGELKESQILIDSTRTQTHAKGWNLTKGVAESGIGIGAFILGGPVAAGTASGLFCVIEGRIVSWISNEPAQPDLSIIRENVPCLVAAATSTVAGGTTLKAARLIDASEARILAGTLNKAIATGTSATVIQQITGVVGGTIQETVAKSEIPTRGDVFNIAKKQVESELDRFTTPEGVTSLIAEAWLSRSMIRADLGKAPLQLELKDSSFAGDRYSQEKLTGLREGANRSSALHVTGKLPRELVQVFSDFEFQSKNTKQPFRISKVRVTQDESGNHGSKNLNISGTFEKDGTKEPTGFFVLTFENSVSSKKTEIRPYLDYLKLDTAPETKGMGSAFTEYLGNRLKQIGYPHLDLEADWQGRGFWGKVGFDFSPDTKVTVDGKPQSQLQLARDNLKRFLDRNQICLEELLIKDKTGSRIVQSLEDLTQVVDFINLTHKDGKKIKVRPYLDEGVESDSVDLDVGFAFAQKSYQPHADQKLDIRAYDGEAVADDALFYWKGSRSFE